MQNFKSIAILCNTIRTTPGVRVGGLGLTDGWDDGLNECVDDGGIDVGNTIREIKRCEI